jgi:hypothetical protein
MSSIPSFLIAGAAFVGLLVFFAQFFGRLVVSYKITDSSIEVRLFGLVSESKTQLKDIVEVRKVTLGEMLPLKNPKSIGWFRLGNRFWSDGVLIRRKRGFFRSFVISPDKPDEFVTELNLKLTASRSP